MVDKMGKHSRRQECQGMLMGDRRHFATGLVHLLNTVRELITTPITRHQQSYGSHSHDATATFAIVLHLFALKQTFTCRQACEPGSTTVCQLRNIPNPGGVKIMSLRSSSLTGLCIIPVKVCFTHIRLRLSSDASHIAACYSHQHATGSEERHLCVIAYQSLAI